MLMKHSRQAAMLTFSVVALTSLAACSTNPYQQPPISQAQRQSALLKLPPDADLTAMDRQFELVNRGLYLLPDGSVKPLPSPTPTALPTHPDPVVTEQSEKKGRPAAVTRNPTHRPQKQRAKPLNEVMVFDAVPSAVDITKGAGR